MQPDDLRSVLQQAAERSWISDLRRMLCGASLTLADGAVILTIGRFDKGSESAHWGCEPMDKKRLEYYKKKLQTRREELLKSIARTEEEGRAADDDPTVDLADKAANSYTKEFLFGQNNTDRATLQLIDEALERIKNNTLRLLRALRNRTATEAPGSCAVGPPLHRLPGKARTGIAVASAP